MTVDRHALALAGAAGLIGSLDTALNIAFPDLSADLALDVGGVQWVIITYVLINGALLVASGRLGDVVGHARVLRVGLWISAFAFLCCGLAPGLGALLVARALQGIGVSLVMASGPALASLAVHESARGRALGTFQRAAALGLVTGPVAGGFLVDWFGWRAVFLFRVPLALGALLLARRVKPATMATATATAAARLDITGSALLAVVTAGTLGALSSGRNLGWGRPVTAVLGACAVAGVACFIVVESRVADPIVDLAVMRAPGFALANVVNALTNGAAFVIWLLVPFLAVNILGHPAKAGGFVLAASPAAVAFVAGHAGRWTDQIGPARVASAGVITCGLGLLGLSSDRAASSTSVLVLTLVVVGIGLGLFQVPNMTFVMYSVGPTRQGMAAGLTSMMRTVGIVAAVSFGSSLFDRRYEALGGRSSTGDAGTDAAAWTGAFGDVVAIAALVALFAAGLTLSRRTSQRNRVAAGADSA